MGHVEMFYSPMIKSQYFSELMNSLDYELHKCFSVFSVLFCFGLVFPPTYMGQDDYNGLELGISLSLYQLGCENTPVN